jgi:hypothetical protein
MSSIPKQEMKLLSFREREDQTVVLFQQIVLRIHFSSQLEKIKENHLLWKRIKVNFFWIADLLHQLFKDPSLRNLFQCKRSCNLLLNLNLDLYHHNTRLTIIGQIQEEMSEKKVKMIILSLNIILKWMLSKKKKNLDRMMMILRKLKQLFNNWLISKEWKIMHQY